MPERVPSPLLFFLSAAPAAPHSVDNALHASCWLCYRDSILDAPVQRGDIPLSSDAASNTTLYDYSVRSSATDVLLTVLFGLFVIGSICYAV